MFDFARELADFAWPLPAVNGTFNAFPLKAKGQRPLPNGVTPRSLNFLSRARGTLFHYPNALYSIEVARKQNDGIVQRRDRSTTNVLLDSGGFSFIGGALRVEDICDVRRDALVAQEQLADAAVVVDVPTACIAANVLGAETFDKCLTLTLDSIDYAVRRRTPDRMKLLNVIQGRTSAEAQRWYDAVKGAPLEGYGFAGAKRKDIGLVLSLLVQMFAAGEIGLESRFHVFGTAHPGVAVFLTAIQRQLRSALRSQGIVFSFDSSTSFSVVQTFGLIVCDLFWDRKQIGLSNYKVAQRAFAIDGQQPWPFRSPLGDVATIGDFLSQTARTGSARNKATDGQGQQMLTHHSVFRELSAIIQANRLFDMEHADDWRQRELILPWSLHQGVEDIKTVFQSVAAGDFKRAISLANKSVSLKAFSGIAEAAEQDR